MSARDELRGVLANTICRLTNYPERAQRHLLGGDMGKVLDRTTDAMLAAGYTKPRIVTTMEKLDALVAGAVVLDRDGDCFQFDGQYWLLAGYGDDFAGHEIALPATVLKDGDAA